MKKNIILILIAIVCVAAVLWGSFTPQQKPARIGILLFTDLNIPTLKGFKDGLSDLDYIEGENIKYIFHGSAPTKKDLEKYMTRILDDAPDLIFSSPTPSTLVAKKMTSASKIPVVFAPVNDPVSAGIVKTTKSPEANITGVRLSASDGLRLASLTEVVPGIRKVFIPYSPEDESSRASLRMLEKAAAKLGIILVKKPFYTNTDILKDREYVPHGIDAILLPREGLVMSRIHSFVEICLDRKLPLSSPRYKQVEQGALTGYGFNGYEVGKQAARLAHRILSGTPISELPVETSEDYLFINLKTAAAIGIKINDAALRQAHNIVR